MQVKDLPPFVREACNERGLVDETTITPMDAMIQYGIWEIGNGSFVKEVIEAYLQLVTTEAELKQEEQIAKIAADPNRQVGELLDAVLKHDGPDLVIDSFQKGMCR